MAFGDSPICLFTLDDSYLTHRTYAFPILRDLGIPATLFPIIEQTQKADRGETALYCTTQDLLDMQAAGWEVGTHAYQLSTHSNIGSMSVDDVVDDVRASQAWLTRNGFAGGGRSFAYPLGWFNGLTTALAPYVSCGRTINAISQVSGPLRPPSMMHLHSQSGIGGPGWNTTTLATTLGQAAAAKNLVVLTFHTFAPTTSTGNVCTEANFVQTVNDVIAAGFQTMTVGEYVRQLHAAA